jgi:hypothetical protein
LICFSSQVWKRHVADVRAESVDGGSRSRRMQKGNADIVVAGVNQGLVEIHQPFDGPVNPAQQFRSSR